jgi:hypothetical protein
VNVRRLDMPPTRDEFWAFSGGLDLVSPTINRPPGRCRDARNVEVGTNGGITVTKGYERFDGRTKPSNAQYTILTITLTGTISVGDTVTGATSGATAVVIAAPSSTQRVVTKVVGTFTNGENLQVAAVTQATYGGTAVVATMALDASYLNLAADEYRDDITAVPGSGSVLGVWQYATKVYAIRNNAGGTAAVLHESSGSGWTAVNLGRELAFTSGGIYEIVVGDTIVGAISGATATIGRVVKTSGDWAAGTAAGFLYFVSQTGTFQAENLDVAANPNVATIAGNSSAVSLAPNGRYDFCNHNFAGTGNTIKMYAASGVHKAFEFDGTRFAFITTGMPTDAPDHVYAHKNHLFLSFGASVQHSSIGNPVAWSVVTGAGEIGVGDGVTNFIGAPGTTTAGALVIFTRSKTFVLYGNSSADWKLDTFNSDGGCLEWTAQWLGQGVQLDDRGVTLMSTSEVFGNFAGADISADVRPYVSTLRDSAIASCVVRDKNQYRLFFSGGAALYITFINNRPAGAMPITLTHAPSCVCSLEAASGQEEIFFGSSNGFVYQMERGTSHDGDNLEWFAALAFNHFKSPRQLKRWRKAVVEVTGSGYAEFAMASLIGYGSSDLPAGDSQTIITSLQPANWDDLDWDDFFWDGQTLSPAEADLDGTAENISLIFSGASDQYEPITLNGAILSYTPQRALR